MKEAAVQQEPSYLGAPYGLASWLLTKDHKRIALLYLISITIFFAIGGTSVAAARLVSRIRSRFPSAAVADIYAHPTVGAMAARLDAIGAPADVVMTGHWAGWGALALMQLLMQGNSYL